VTSKHPELPRDDGENTMPAERRNCEPTPAVFSSGGCAQQSTPSASGTPVLMKPTQVARSLHVSRSWVYAAAADGRLPSLRLGGPDGPLRFVAADITAWLEGERAKWTPGIRP